MAETNVDLLEQELYAVTQSADDFVKIPRWVKLWTKAWYGGGACIRAGRRTC